MFCGLSLYNKLIGQIDVMRLIFFSNSILYN